MPLNLAPLHQALKIINVIVKQPIKKYLESLGIVKNETISLISISNGNVVCEVKGSRLALNSQIASNIIVI